MARLNREQLREQTRERLLEAARGLFIRGGFAATSIDAIAEAAGYSKGAFYSNFDSKETLFLVLLERHMTSELATSAGFFDETAGAEVIIERIADRYATNRDDADWCLLSIEFALHASRSPEFAVRHAELFRQHHEGIAGIVARIAELSGRTAANPAVSAVAFVAFRQGLALDQILPMSALTPAEARKALEKFIRDQFQA